MTRVPSHAPETKDRPPEAQTAQHGEEASEFWTILGHRLKITDTLLVCVSALLFFATVALWWATRDLVTGAERTAKTQLRAYLGPSDASLMEFNKRPRVHINLKNFGATPASGVVAITKRHIACIETDDWAGATLDPVHNFGMIDPGHSPEIVILFDEPFTEDEKVDLRADNRRGLHIKTEVTYRTIFSEVYTRTFCHYLNGHIIGSGFDPIRLDISPGENAETSRKRQ